MARVWNRFRNYERHFLIGLVVVLLATFSISGLIRGAGREGGPKDYGGSFLAAPGVRATVSSDEYVEARARYVPFLKFGKWGPSIRFAEEIDPEAYLFYLGRPALAVSDDAAVWMHVTLVRAAKEAGFRAGDDEVREAVELLVERAMSVEKGERSTGFSPEAYERVLANLYNTSHGGSVESAKADFETTVREILLKDKFLAQAVDPMRFARERREAYEDWKSSHERIEVGYVAVKAAPFEPDVKREEETREKIQVQSDALGKLLQAVQDLRRISALVKDLHESGGGKPYPEDAKAFGAATAYAAALGLREGALPSDPWGHPLLYRRQGDGFELWSAGPDGKEGTGDDVGAAVLDTVRSLEDLRQTAEALVDWQKAAGKWPDSLALLTSPPPVTTGPKVPAPLSKVPLDGWGHDFLYDAAGPTLLSAGADGVKGTEDDLVATVGAGRARVALPARLAAFAGAAAQDAWDRPLVAVLKTGATSGFDVVSPGPDGVLGNDDDVTTGNATDLSLYYGEVRNDYRVPAASDVEAVYVHLPLVPDSVLAKAWKEHPEWRPDEKTCFARWSQAKGQLYVVNEGEAPDAPAIDPADPVKGHGAALVLELKKAGKIPQDAKAWLVPAADAFGDLKDPPADSAHPATDLEWKDYYVGRGWRRVLLREVFFENCLKAILTKSREAWTAHQKWEAAKKKDAAKAGPEPALVGFEEQLTALAGLQPSEDERKQGAQFLVRWTSGGTLTHAKIDETPELGDANKAVTSVLGSMKEGEYAAHPTPMKGALGRAILHVVKLDPPHDAPLETVRGEVWPRYLASRAMERAKRELDRVRADTKEKALIADVAKAAAEKRHFEFFQGTTGRYVKRSRFDRYAVPDDATPEAKAEAARRSFARSRGDADDVLGEVKTSLAVGTVGRRVVADEATGKEPGTGCAYLVQVLWREDASPEEFTGKQFAEWLARKAYEPPDPRAGPKVLSRRTGYMDQWLGRWLDNWDVFRATFEVKTEQAIEPTNGPRH